MAIADAPRTNNPNGRPSNAALLARAAAWRDRAEDLAVEITARDAEQVDLADELVALSRRVQVAILNDRADVALHVAGRLDALAEALRRRSAA